MPPWVKFIITIEDVDNNHRQMYVRHSHRNQTRKLQLHPLFCHGQFVPIPLAQAVQYCRQCHFFYKLPNHELFEEHVYSEIHIPLRQDVNVVERADRLKVSQYICFYHIKISRAFLFQPVSSIKIFLAQFSFDRCTSFHTQLSLLSSDYASFSFSF